MTDDQRVVSGEAERIGVLGGSFDPLHNGHLAIARAAAQRHRLPRVLFVPNNIPPHKESGAVASAAHRLEMVRLAIGDEPSFEVSRIEIDRPGRSYSYWTATTLTREFPEAELFFIVGSDCLRELGTWYMAGELVRLVHLVVVARESSIEGPLRAARDVLPVETVEQIAADAVPIEPVDISSTQVRDLICAGQDIRHLVPEPVRQYIARHGLYGHAREGGS